VHFLPRFNLLWMHIENERLKCRIPLAAMTGAGHLAHVSCVASQSAWREMNHARCARSNDTHLT